MHHQPGSYCNSTPLPDCPRKTFVKHTAAKAFLAGNGGSRQANPLHHPEICLGRGGAQGPPKVKVKLRRAQRPGKELG